MREKLVKKSNQLLKNLIFSCVLHLETIGIVLSVYLNTVKPPYSGHALNSGYNVYNLFFFYEHSPFFFFWLSLSMINLLIWALCHAGNILKLIGSFLTVITNYMIRGTNSLSPTQPDRTINVYINYKST